jgi:hypothetical protein
MIYVKACKNYVYKKPCHAAPDDLDMFYVLQLEKLGYLILHETKHGFYMIPKGYKVEFEDDFIAHKFCAFDHHHSHLEQKCKISGE